MLFIIITVLSHDYQTNRWYEKQNNLPDAFEETQFVVGLQDGMRNECVATDEMVAVEI